MMFSGVNNLWLLKFERTDLRYILDIEWIKSADWMWETREKVKETR